METKNVLSPAVRALLKTAQRYAANGHMYLVPAPRGRVSLVAHQTPTAGLARLQVMSWETVRSALHAGLVEVPDGHVTLDLPRARGHGDSGEVIRLTADGVAAI